MKLLYVSSTAFFDTDFPLIKVLKKKVSITSLFFIYPDNIKATMIDIDTFYPQTGIFKATDIYPEFIEYSDCLDLEHTYVLNRKSRNKFSLENIISYFMLIYFILKNRFDAIYTTIIFHVIDWPLFLFAKKIYSAFHDPIPHSGTNVEKNKRMYHNMIERVKRCIIFNETYKSDFSDTFNIPEDKIYVSRLGLNDIFKRYVSDIRVEDSDYILFWGRIEPYKGIEYLLEAMKIVHLKCPSLKLIVAGRGNFYFDVSNYQNLDYITFNNRFLTVSELADLVQNCKYVVCPYKDATQSGVITTAFAFGKPIIGTNVGAIPEYVKNNFFGFIVPPCNSELLAKAIIKFEEQPTILNDFSYNINTYYNTGNGSWNSIADNLIKNISK